MNLLFQMYEQLSKLGFRPKVSQSVIQRIISEFFVPYMDPTVHWFFKTYLDIGRFMVSLEPLADCPANAAFLDAYVAGKDDTPIKIAKEICVLDKYARDIIGVIYDVRPDVSLGVRIVLSVDNYD
ncbi:Primary amine oxidase 2, partial [Mucuna pruriens]